VTNRNPESYFRDNDLVPFIGVVENTDDPMQIGRVQVRAIGFHPERSDAGVPTDHLPWAYVALPTTASGMSGVGSTHGLIDGSWVFGYFLDGRDAQQPFITNSFVGAPGLSPLQKEYVGSNLALSSMGPGGLSGAFQTMAAKAVGGLGTATKFGSTAGGLLSLANFLKNDDAVKTLIQYIGVGPTGQDTPRMAQVIDVATVESVQTTAVKAAKTSAGLGLSVLTNLPQALMGLFAAGGATGIPQGVGGSPLSSASFGTTAKAGQEITASNITVDVKTDYDFLAEGAGQDLGMITVLSTGTSKSRRYTIEALRRDANARTGSDGKGGGAHIVIDQTGQIIKMRDFTSEGAHTKGMNTISVGGQGMSNLGVQLIGGLAAGKGTNQTDSPINSKYYPVQLAALEKVVGAFVRKFPKVVIGGQNEISGASGPGFNVSEWASARWPNNVNTAMGGEKKVSAPVSSTAGAATLSPSNLDTTGSGQYGDSPEDQKTTTGNRRGFQGGPSHPIPAYAAKRQSDVPAMARTNALTTGRGINSPGAAVGGPAQQYAAKIEEPTMWSFPKARAADTLEARSIPEKWSAAIQPHGGEYMQAHVVRSTEGGHHILLDDTSGRQKIEVMHSSGSMIQIQADGSGLFYVKKDGYEVVLGDKMVGIQGSMHLSVGGDMKVTVKGDLAYDVTGKISFNGASGMTELIRGDRNTITEGSHLFQAKKNAVHKVGKDMSQSVGGKMSTSVKGTRHDVTDGNASRTTRGEDSTYVAGNKVDLTLGTAASHAQNMITQSQGESITVAGGNMMTSAKGKMSIVGEGDMILETKGASKIVSGDMASITSGGGVDINASGDINIDGSTVKVEAGASAAVTGTDTADVEAPPAQLTRESNIADSKSNLNAEQITQGEMDAAEAMDNSGETGASTSGSINSGGGASAQDAAFTQAESGGTVTTIESLGNFEKDACDIANDLVGRGWSQQGASAIVGNMINESGLRTAIQVTDVNSLQSGGLIQWNGSRFNALRSYSANRGLNWQTREAQLGFLDFEARNAERGAGSRLISATEMEGAIRAGADYERFDGYQLPFTGGAWENQNGNRASNALGVFNACFGGNIPSIGGQAASTIQGYTGGKGGSTGSGGSGEGGGGGGGGGWGGGTGGDATTVDQGTGNIGSSEGVRGPLIDGGAVDWGRKVSDHYTLGDLAPTSKFYQGMNPTPRGNISSDELIRNLSGCAVNVLEPISAHIGKAHVMSGYRSLAYNQSLARNSSGVATNSDHIYGKAVDVQVPGRSPAFVANWVEANLPNVAGIGRYPTFTHVSFYLQGNSGRLRKWGRN